MWELKKISISFSCVWSASLTQTIATLKSFSISVELGQKTEREWETKWMKFKTKPAIASTTPMYLFQIKHLYGAPKTLLQHSSLPRRVESLSLIFCPILAQNKIDAPQVIIEGACTGRDKMQRIQLSRGTAWLDGGAIHGPVKWPGSAVR